ncbi:hypothetical protein JCM5296_005603 [Sporobolomyces johnsonii]
MSSSASRSGVGRAGGGGEAVAGPAEARRAAASGKKGSEPALSASLVLLAMLPEPAPDGHDYRVLLLKRHESSRTYTNAYVFPGGNVDPIDGDTSAWPSSFFPSLAPFTAGGASPPSTTASTSSSLSDADLQTVKLCALRETFEESGVLLFEALPESEGAQPDALVQAEKTWIDKNGLRKTELREEVHKSGAKFVELFEKELGAGVRPAVGRLTHWANWITPLGLPRRFDTHFFISILPPSSSASSSHHSHHYPHSLLATSDGVETSIAEWLTPSEAIRRALAHVAQLPSHLASIPSTTAQYAPQPASMGDNPSDAIILHPPQFYLLAELAHNHKSYRSLLLADRSASANPSTPPVVRPRAVRPFTPQIAHVVDSSGKKRGATLLPGDEDFVPPSLDVGSAFVVRELGKGSADGEGKGQGKMGGRHRTYVLPPGKGVQGLTVLGVHRKGMQDELGVGWEDMQAGDVGENGSNRARL